MPQFNHFNQNQSRKPKTSQGTDNFVEALRSIGRSVKKGVTKDLIADSGQTMVNTIFNRTPHSSDFQPKTQIEIDQINKEQEEQISKIEHLRHHQLKHKEEIIFSAQEDQTQNEIKKLQQELKSLANELGDVAREVQIASIQETAEPGQYHITFFQHLRNLVISLKQKLTDSKSWLQTANKRTDQKNGFFWTKAKKHGTKYTMSEERRKATQSG